MRARFVCQVNWYITRFKFYVQEQFLIWYFFFVLFVEIQICYSFTGAWRMPCFISNEIYRMKSNWQPKYSEKIVIFCTISRNISCSFQSLCDFNAYLINNTSNVSSFRINIAGQHQPIIHVQLIGWCQMSYIPIAMQIQQPRKSSTSCVVNWFAIC